MRQRRTILVMIVFLVLLSLALTVGVVAAQTSSTSGSKLTYSGHLTDPEGQPVADGLYDFVFTLYATEKDNQALWSETQSGVSVKSGSLNVVLGQNLSLPKEIASRNELWLAVSVRGPYDSNFTLLSPRQQLNAPAGGGGGTLTCPHSHFSDSWSGGNYNSYGLSVTNSGGGDGIDAYSYSTRTLYAAVYGYNLAGTGNGTGVYGGSYYGSGVQAYSQYNDGLEATSDTTWASAIYAHSANGNGVWAVSTNKIGVYGATYTNTRGMQAAHFVNLNTTASISNSALWVGSYWNTLIEGHDIDSSGNSMNRTFWVARWGDVRADGTFASPAADLAEMLPASQKLEPGDVLVIGLDGKLARSTKPYEAAVVGVYSTKPAFLGGTSGANEAVSSRRLVDAKTGKRDVVPLGADGDIPLAVSGVVPVKVCDENGPILPGDLLVSSSTPGYAMKAGASAPQGTVIGKALAALENGTGTIKMLTMLR